MGASGKETNWEFGQMADLASSQKTHHGQFEQILEDLRSAGTRALSEWEGDGTDEYAGKKQKLETGYRDLQKAFLNLQAATDTSHGTAVKAGNTLRGIWA